MFGLHMKSTEQDGDTYPETITKSRVWLATKYTTLSEVVSDLLTTQEGNMQAVVTNMKQRLADGTTEFYDALKKHHSKPLLACMKLVSTTQNVEKAIKVARKLLQRLPNVVIAGRTVQMVNMLKR